MLSATPTQTSIHFHYTAGAIAPLVAATVLGAALLARRFPAGKVAVVAVLVALVASWKIGASRCGAPSRAGRTTSGTTGA